MDWRHDVIAILTVLASVYIVYVKAGEIHFMGDCQAKTDHCATEGAVCRPVGSLRQLRCACETETEYFNPDLQQCRKKIAFGERCLNRDDECLVDGASCQDGSNKCLCEHNDFLDTESAVCRRRLQYGETCQTDTDCWSSDRGVQCLQDGTSRKCLCQTDEFLDKESSVCRKKIHFMGDCQAKTDHCATEGAVCRPVGSLRQLRCACDTETEYFNPDFQQCRKKIAFGKRCLNRDDECLVDGASCQDGSNKCLCEHNHFLDTESAVCRRRLQYGETCQTDTDCWSSDRGVQCLQDGTSRKCLCQTDEFLDKESSVCRKKIAFGKRCLNRDDECLVDGASCQDGSNKCLCEHNHFLDTESARCRRRLQYGETCQTDTDCWSSDRGVQCLQDGTSRKCLCQTDEFLDKESSVCRKKIAFGKRCLNRDDECLVDGASCQDGSNKCLCEHNHFLDTESARCRRKIAFGKRCLNRDDECLVDGASCQDGSNKCLCEHNDFLDTESAVCRRKIAFGERCLNRDDECLVDGASCQDGSNKCLCEHNDFLDTESAVCRRRLHNDETCQKDTDCCSDSGVQCLQDGTSRKSLCQTDEFLDKEASVCRKKIHFMGECNAKTDHCATEEAVCRPVGSFGQLRCACETDTEYFNADPQQCMKKISFGERCPNREDVCLVDGASCQYGSNTCLCDHNHFLDTESAMCRRMPDIENGHWRQSGNLWENMGEKWIMSCNDGYFVDGCAVVRNYQGKWNRDMPKCLSKTANWAKWCAKNVYLGIHYARIAGSAMVELMMSIVTILKSGGKVPDIMVDKLQLEGVLRFGRVARTAIGRAASTRAAATQFVLWNAEGCEEV